MKEYSGSAIHKHRRQRGLYEHRLLYRRGSAAGAGGAGAAGREEARQGASGADSQRHSLGSSLDGSSEFGESTDVLNLL